MASATLIPSAFPCSLPSVQAKKSLHPRFSSRNLEARPSTHARPPSNKDCRESEPPSPSKRSRDRKKSHRKLRPSFYDQTLDRWSVKVPSRRSEFPWQATQPPKEEDSGRSSPAASGGNSRNTQLGDAENQVMGLQSRLSVIIERLNDGYPSDSSADADDTAVHSPIAADERSGFNSRLGIQLGSRVVAPWVHGGESRNGYPASAAKTEMQPERVEFGGDDGNDASFLDGDRLNASLDSNWPNLSPSASAGSNLAGRGITIPVASTYGDAARSDLIESKRNGLESGGENQNALHNAGCNAETGIIGASLIVEKLQSSLTEENYNLNAGISSGRSNYEHESNKESDVAELIESNTESDVAELIGSLSFPWEREGGDREGERLHRRTNTELVERIIPEPELRRLRNVSLRMKERIKVGASGVTDVLVQTIHEKWKKGEVVKLKFEGPPSMNMKRTHEVLESKTGGMVIWRSGSLLVLYRGMSYELPCVQSYTKLANAGSKSNALTIDIVRGRMNSLTGDSNRPDTNMVASFPNSTEESSDTSDIDSFLDQLGPRFKDWSGRDPLPIDADLLPGVVPGYTTPFRLLPYKTRSCLSNREMTSLRRLARTMPPHFALGRNRQQQGLANAMVKLWDKSAIAKIAVKRGVLNICNERMAEEIKKLTGGILVSRNKEYIVFYRGNDFLTPSIRKALEEKQKLAAIKQDDEEIARLRASSLIVSNVKTAKGPLVAGTLAETIEAKSRWANELSSIDRENMKRDLDLAKHASLVRFLERKLAIAKGKVRKAEKALAKVQEFLQPANLPTDLETVTDEERFLFRRMGLKMSAFLLLGRREVFDGTIQNMHLNWKHRELVKINVKGKNFAQVKQIAISLEAESGGVLISLDKTTKGYAIVIYRGKNYQRPSILRPNNLLTRRQALARSIELQRREALNNHISNLQQRIQMMRSQLDQLEANKAMCHKDLDLEIDDTSISEDDVEDEGPEAYLETYSGGDADDGAYTED